MDDFEFLLEDRKQKIKSVTDKYGLENFAISYSGGKDSVVLDWLWDQSLPGNTTKRVFQHTGLEWNLVVNFVKKRISEDSRFEMNRPQRNVKQVLDEYGYPFKSKEHARYLDIYQRRGKTKQYYRYLEPDESRKRYGCPGILRYQFSPDFDMKISARCCVEMKEKPLKDWQKKNNIPYMVTGIRRGEGGQRNSATCLAFNDKNKTKLKQFHPLAPIESWWVDEVIKRYDIEICKIYLSPYDWDRTGCRLCPFSPTIQKEMDKAHEFFPNEEHAAEIIFRESYLEYLKIGYRLNHCYYIDKDDEHRKGKD